MTTLLAARGRRWPDTTPYAMPTVAPWNAPTYAITPTPDGTGSTVHPSVVDMGRSWRGFRYWMAVTPHLNSGEGLENPCILRSHDGYTWEVPVGLTNPLETPAAGTGYNSDTELVWDPEERRLVCYWRRVYGGETVYASTSHDGSTWSAPVQQYQILGGDAALLSPCVVRLAAGQWRMFYVNSAQNIAHVSATSPLGPWGTVVEGTHTPAIGQLWHLGVQYVDGILYAILDERTADWQHWPATSADGGLTWTVGAAYMGNVAGWDNSLLYRAQFQPHENGTHFRIWYSAYSSASSWRTGYTQAPRSLWPDPSE